MEALWRKFDQKLRRYDELERLMGDPSLVADADGYAAFAKEYASLTRLVARYRRFKQLETQIASAEELRADPDMAGMADEELTRLRPERAELESELVDMLLTQPEEQRGSLIMEIRGGTGGEEATLFARDLFEMYRRYAESRRWAVELLDFHVSEHRGYKEVSFSITGQDAFRELRYESGGHRVQRVPETEAQGRIHTSAATVAVMAEPEDVEVQIRPEDLDMEFTRSSGPGGQHVNKTSSAVRLTHKPTGLVVFCQDERSQHKNRAKALRLLRSRLFDRMEQQQHSARSELRRTLVGSGDRSERIRTYNFPQNRCTDHRIGENFNLDEIIAGNMQKLIKAMQGFDRQQRLAQLAETL